MDKHGAREECEDDGKERDGHGGWPEASNTTININSLMTKTITTSHYHNHIGHHSGYLQETGGPYGRITHLDLNATVTVSDNNNNNNNNNSI